jgi:drug/metabolite transporter (DMT)-like permease
VTQGKDHLDLGAILTLLLLCVIWGFNHSSIKYSNQGISPIFASTLRSIVASICGIAYGLYKRERLFHTDIRLFHGIMVGVLFGIEFACIYLGLLFTDAARSIVFVNLSPFIVALGAHFFLKGDRLSGPKLLGLIVAFSGIVAVFYGRPRAAKSSIMIGDLLQITAAFFWGATTIYIKRFMAGKVMPINTFLYQLFFSIPILLLMSFLLEPKWVYGMGPAVFGALFFQGVIIAFVSYFIWFKLIYNYAVSRLASFTFFTPIFGVLTGVLLLKEEFTGSLMVGLPLVCLGIFLVNWNRAGEKPVPGPLTQKC